MEEKVLEILKKTNKELLSYTGPNMVDDDIIDSFGLISLIGELEEAFGIEIDAEYITEEYVGNKERILKLIGSLVNE